MKDGVSDESAQEAAAEFLVALSDGIQWPENPLDWHQIVAAANRTGSSTADAARSALANAEREIGPAVAARISAVLSNRQSRQFKNHLPTTLLGMREVAVVAPAVLMGESEAALESLVETLAGGRATAARPMVIAGLCIALADSRVSARLMTAAPWFGALSSVVSASAPEGRVTVASLLGAFAAAVSRTPAPALVVEDARADLSTVAEALILDRVPAVRAAAVRAVLGNETGTDEDQMVFPLSSSTIAAAYARAADTDAIVAAAAVSGAGKGVLKLFPTGVAVLGGRAFATLSDLAVGHTTVAAPPAASPSGEEVRALESVQAAAGAARTKGESSTELKALVSVPELAFPAIFGALPLSVASSAGQPPSPADAAVVVALLGELAPNVLGAALQAQTRMVCALHRAAHGRAVDIRRTTAGAAPRDRTERQADASAFDVLVRTIGVSDGATSTVPSSDAALSACMTLPLPVLKAAAAALASGGRRLAEVLATLSDVRADYGARCTASAALPGLLAAEWPEGEEDGDAAAAAAAAAIVLWCSPVATSAVCTALIDAIIDFSDAQTANAEKKVARERRRERAAAADVTVVEPSAAEHDAAVTAVARRDICGSASFGRLVASLASVVRAAPASLTPRAAGDLAAPLRQFLLASPPEKADAASALGAMRRSGVLRSTELLLTALRQWALSARPQEENAPIIGSSFLTAMAPRSPNIPQSSPPPPPLSTARLGTVASQLSADHALLDGLAHAITELSPLDPPLTWAAAAALAALGTSAEGPRPCIGATVRSILSRLPTVASVTAAAAPDASADHQLSPRIADVLGATAALLGSSVSTFVETSSSMPEAQRPLAVASALLRHDVTRAFPAPAAASHACTAALRLLVSFLFSRDAYSAAYAVFGEAQAAGVAGVLAAAAPPERRRMLIQLARSHHDVPENVQAACSQIAGLLRGVIDSAAGHVGTAAAPGESAVRGPGPEHWASIRVSAARALAALRVTHRLGSNDTNADFRAAARVALAPAPTAACGPLLLVRALVPLAVPVNRAAPDLQFFDAATDGLVLAGDVPARTPESLALLVVAAGAAERRVGTSAIAVVPNAVRALRADLDQRAQYICNRENNLAASRLAGKENPTDEDRAAARAAAHRAAETQIASFRPELALIWALYGFAHAVLYETEAAWREGRPAAGAPLTRAVRFPELEKEGFDRVIRFTHACVKLATTGDEAAALRQTLVALKQRYDVAAPVTPDAQTAADAAATSFFLTLCEIVDAALAARFRLATPAPSERLLTPRGLLAVTANGPRLGRFMTNATRDAVNTAFAPRER